MGVKVNTKPAKASKVLAIPCRKPFKGLGFHYGFLYGFRVLVRIPFKGSILVEAIADPRLSVRYAMSGFIPFGGCYEVTTRLLQGHHKGTIRGLDLLYGR